MQAGSIDAVESGRFAPLGSMRILRQMRLGWVNGRGGSAGHFPIAASGACNSCREGFLDAPRIRGRQAVF